MACEANILVVDDEPIVRESLGRLLSFLGYTVNYAASGIEALAVFAPDKFQVIITDFAMPGMRGDQLVQRIRTVAPDQVIVMITALADELKSWVEETGCVNALLSKPISLAELQGAINSVLSRSLARGNPS